MNEAQIKYNDSYVTFRSIFTADECSRIIEFANNSNSYKDGVVWDNDKNTYVVNRNVRQVQTTYHPRTAETKWIFERMDKCFQEAAVHFGMMIRSESEEDIKIMKYGTKDHFSRWHRDTGPDYSRFRKISMTILLCDKSLYEGGCLEINIEKKERPILRFNVQQGGGVAFPSDRLHRVAPIVSGTRYSLVNWIN